MDREPQEIIEALDSEDSRQVLSLASLEPMSVRDFEEESRSRPRRSTVTRAI